MELNEKEMSYLKSVGFEIRETSVIYDSDCCIYEITKTEDKYEISAYFTFDNDVDEIVKCSSSKNEVLEEFIERILNV